MSASASDPAPIKETKKKIKKTAKAAKAKVESEVADSVPPPDTAATDASEPRPTAKRKRKKKVIPEVIEEKEPTASAAAPSEEPAPEPAPKKSRGGRVKNAMRRAMDSLKGDDTTDEKAVEPAKAPVSEDEPPKRKKKKSRKPKAPSVDDAPKEDAPASGQRDIEDAPAPPPKKTKKKRAAPPPSEPSSAPPSEKEPTAVSAASSASAPASGADSAADDSDAPAKASGADSDGEVESDDDGAPNEDSEVTELEVALVSMAGLGHMLRNEHRLRRIAEPAPLHPADEAAANGDEGARDLPADDDGRSASAGDDNSDASNSDDDSASDSAGASDSDDDGKDSTGVTSASNSEAAPKKGHGRKDSGIHTSSDVDLTESVASFSESEPEAGSERGLEDEPAPAPEPEAKIPIDVLSGHIPVFVHHTCVDMTVQKHKLLVNRKIRACKYWNYPPKSEPLRQQLADAEDDEAKEEIEEQLSKKREDALAEEVEAAEMLKNWRRYQDDIKDLNEESQEELDEHIEDHKEHLEAELQAIVDKPSTIFKELADMWQQEFEYWEGLKEDADTGLAATSPYKFERVYAYPAAFKKAAVQAQLFNLRLGSRLAKIAAHARKLKDDQGAPEEREWLTTFFMDGHDKGTLREWAKKLKEDIAVWKGRSSVTRCRFDRKL